MSSRLAGTRLLRPFVFLFIVSISVVMLHTATLSAAPTAASVSGITGATQFDIPLEVIPGMGGVQPGLRLLYSSRGSMGSLGFGWSLPHSSITLDMLHHPDPFANPQYLLDGVPIVKGSPLSYDSNQTGSALYPMILDGSEVKMYTQMFSPGTRFQVTTADGWLFEYGTTQEGNIIVPSPYGEITVEAKLVRAVDPHGLGICYRYKSLGDSYQRHLKAIEYTYDGKGTCAEETGIWVEENPIADPNPQTSELSPPEEGTEDAVGPLRKIEFVYDFLPKTWTHYRYSVPQTNSANLVLIHEYLGPERVRSYELHYQDTTDGGVVLQSIFHKGRDNGTAPDNYRLISEFGYSPDGVAWNSWDETFDIEGAGSALQSGDANGVDLDWFDLNGDGLPDRVRLDSCDGEPCLCRHISIWGQDSLQLLLDFRLAMACKKVANIGLEEVTALRAFDTDGNVTSEFLDFGGDGHLDVLRLEDGIYESDDEENPNPDDPNDDDSSSPPNPEDLFGVYADVNGDGGPNIQDVVCSIIGVFAQNDENASEKLACMGGVLKNADTNCDGIVNITDVLLVINAALDIAVSPILDENENGWPDACDQITIESIAEFDAKKAGLKLHRRVDHQWQNEWASPIHLSLIDVDGTDFSPKAYLHHSKDGIQIQGIIDLTGDGRPDYVKAINENDETETPSGINGLKVWRNNGSSFGPVEIWEGLNILGDTETAGNTVEIRQGFADINGDGILDWVNTRTEEMEEVACQPGASDTCPWFVSFGTGYGYEAPVYIDTQMQGLEPGDNYIPLSRQNRQSVYAGILEIIPCQGSETSLGLMDLDSNGLLDIVRITGAESEGDAKYDVALNVAGNGFLPATPFTPPGDAPSGVCTDWPFTGPGAQHGPNRILNGHMVGRYQDMDGDQILDWVVPTHWPEETEGALRVYTRTTGENGAQLRPPPFARDRDAKFRRNGHI